MNQIWVQLDGRQQGPFSLEQLRGMNLSPDTPVWYEGLPQWTFAAAAPVTSVLFAQAGQPHGFYGAGAYGAHAAPGYPPSAPEVCPPTYLAWSILVTLCCCIPAGIVAIFYASQVTSRFMNHDYEGAWRASSRAETWIVISIVLGLISLPFGFVGLL